MTTIAVAFALSAVGVVADAFLKLAGKEVGHVNWKLLLLGSAVYVSTIPGWFFVIRRVDLTVVAITYSVSTLLLLVAVDVLFFKTKLQLQEVVGIVIALVALFLLRRFM